MLKFSLVFLQVNLHKGFLASRSEWGICVSCNDIYVERAFTDSSWIIFPQKMQLFPVPSSTGIVPVKPLGPAY